MAVLTYIGLLAYGAYAVIIYYFIPMSAGIRSVLNQLGVR